MDKQFWEIHEVHRDSDIESKRYELGYDITKDEQLSPYIEAVKTEQSRPKQMTVSILGQEMFDTIINKLRLLLQSDHCSYTLQTKTYNSAPKALIIDLITDGLGISKTNCDSFRDIMQLVDGIEISPALHDNVNITFGLNNFFVET